MSLSWFFVACSGAAFLCFSRFVNGQSISTTNATQIPIIDHDDDTSLSDDIISVFSDVFAEVFIYLLLFSIFLFIVICIHSTFSRHTKICSKCIINDSISSFGVILFILQFKAFVYQFLFAIYLFISNYFALGAMFIVFILLTYISSLIAYFHIKHSYLLQFFVDTQESFWCCLNKNQDDDEFDYSNTNNTKKVYPKPQAFPYGYNTQSVMNVLDGWGNNKNNNSNNSNNSNNNNSNSSGSSKVINRSSSNIDCHWIKNNESMFFKLSILFGSTFTAIEICNCGAFGCLSFTMGLTHSHMYKFRVWKLFMLLIFQV